MSLTKSHITIHIDVNSNPNFIKFDFEKKQIDNSLKDR